MAHLHAGARSPCASRSVLLIGFVEQRIAAHLTALSAILVEEHRQDLSDLDGAASLVELFEAGYKLPITEVEDAPLAVPAGRITDDVPTVLGKRKQQALELALAVQIKINN